MAELHRESMLENEDDGVREEWVTMLTAAGKAYAAAGDIYQAIATINLYWLLGTSVRKIANFAFFSSLVA